jgi:type IV pilus assembly protein PilC
MKNETAEMTTYLWEGLNKHGLRVKGELASINATMVQTELKKQEITVIKICKKPKLFIIFKEKIKSQDITLISRYLATMNVAGISLVQALDISAKSQTKTKTQSLINEIKNDVASGKTFYESLKKHPKYFGELFCSLIQTGEQSGTLDIVLEQLANHLEKTEVLKKQIMKAMYYPATVLCTACLVAILLMLFVVPQFEKLFKSFGAQLPLFTRMVIDLSLILQSYWYIFGVLIVTIICLLIYGRKNSKKFTLYFDRMLLTIPIFGSFQKKVIIARVTRTLATTLSAGIPMLQALNSAATVTGNSVYTHAILQVSDGVATGQQIHAAMNFSQVFPNMVVQMIAIGEESGAVDSMLDKIATFYEQELDNMISGLTALMEPLIIIILSIVIGGFILAMYLPIFRLGSII